MKCKPLVSIRDHFILITRDFKSLTTFFDANDRNVSQSLLICRCLYC